MKVGDLVRITKTHNSYAIGKRAIVIKVVDQWNVRLCLISTSERLYYGIQSLEVISESR